MKRIILLTLAVILTACSAQAPQVTVTSVVTVTSTPPPASTPTSTVHPQSLAIQEQIAQSDIYTLRSDGQIEMQTPDGVVILPDILVSKDGTMTVTHEGKEFEADPATIKIDGQVLTFQDKEGKTWVWDGENLKEEIAEIREFVPANDIVYEESLSDMVTDIDPAANPEAIYWDVITSKIMDTKSIEGNREIHDQILADTELIEKHPEWKDLSHNLPKESKKAYMTEFLKRTGGTMVIKDAKWQKHTVDFNQNVKFTVEEVPAMTSEYPTYNNNTLGLKQHVSENGELTFSILTIKGSLKQRVGSGLWQNLTAGQVISVLFWHMISGSSLVGDNTILNTTDYTLYLNADPADANFYIRLSKSFID